jgi:ribosomal protein RSM22 (predicted rRNA methylase)
MQLPLRLQEAIEQQVSKIKVGQLTRAAADLSERYRNQKPDKFISTDEDRLAYAAVRMPATFAAARAVFAEIHRLVPEMIVRSLLDLGAGPGTAAWAAVDVFEALSQITLVEQDRGLVQLGKTLGRDHDVLRLAEWQISNLEDLTELPVHDLIICSYSLGELEGATRILNLAWQAAQHAIAIIEPGTTKGFELIREMREELIKAGAHIIAPCPHELTCPMQGADWCHFSQRFDRSSLHRRIKSGALSYEDEKYSYIAAAKSAVNPVKARVIRHPLRHSGHTRIQLCTTEQLQNITVTRSEKENWKRARKVGWGDGWE